MNDERYDYNTQYSGDDYSFNTEPEKKPKKKKGGAAKRLGAALSTGVVFGLAAGLVFYGIVSATGVTKASVETSTQGAAVEAEIQQTQTANTTASELQELEGGNAADGTYSVAQIAKECTSSVVAITCSSVEEVQTFFGTQEYATSSAGTGIIVGKNDTELLIATNNHVVTGAEELSVCFNDDENQVYEAATKGTDSTNDLAVVAVALEDLSEETLSSIKIATLGDSDKLVVGEQVVAIGNALGYGQSVTSGYVSALDRAVTIDNNTTYLIQTDAAINPGNSGGALLNMKGEVVGINSAKFSDEEVEGMGYAIPITTAKEIIDDLMTRQTRTAVDESERGYLGITCRNVSEEASQMYNIPTGVYVAEVGENGAAEAAGIKVGDIITSFDGQTVTTKTELVNLLAGYRSGETVDVVLYRASGGEYIEQTVTVTLAEQVISSDSTQNSQDSRGNTMPYQGGDSDDESGLFDNYLR